MTHPTSPSGFNRRRALIAAGLTAGAAVQPTIALASHHFESVAARKDPALGLIDLFVFNSPDSDRTVFILTVNFLPKPGVDLLNRNALYNIHCATSKDLKEGMTWTFAYDGKQVACTRSGEPNGAIGAKGKSIGHLTPDKEGELAGGIRARIGRAKDPFFGNSPGLHAYRAQIAEGRYDPSIWEKASGTNIFLGRECGVIVLEVPNQMLGKDIAVFSTVAQRQGSKWQQVQYMAKPLIAHTMLFDDDTLKTAYNTSRPNTQGEFKNFFKASIARSAHFAGGRADAFSYADKTTELLLPDVLRYEVGSEASFTAEKLNGRKLTDDAMSTTLTLLIGKPTSQHLKDPGNYNVNKFPYVLST